MMHAKPIARPTSPVVVAITPRRKRVAANSPNRSDSTSSTPTSIGSGSSSSSSAGSGSNNGTTKKKRQRRLKCALTHCTNTTETSPQCHLRSHYAIDGRVCRSCCRTCQKEQSTVRCVNVTAQPSLEASQDAIDALPLPATAGMMYVRKLRSTLPTSIRVVNLSPQAGRSHFLLFLRREGVKDQLLEVSYLCNKRSLSSDEQILMHGPLLLIFHCYIGS